MIIFKHSLKLIVGEWLKKDETVNTLNLLKKNNPTAIGRINKLEFASNIGSVQQ